MSNTVLICTPYGEVYETKSLSIDYGPEKTIERIQSREDWSIEFARVVDIDYPLEWWHVQHEKQAWDGRRVTHTYGRNGDPRQHVFLGEASAVLSQQKRQVAAIAAFGGVLYTQVQTGVDAEGRPWRYLNLMADWGFAYDRYLRTRSQPGGGPFGDTRPILGLDEIIAFGHEYLWRPRRRVSVSSPG